MRKKVDHNDTIRDIFKYSKKKQLDKYLISTLSGQIHLSLYAFISLQPSAIMTDLDNIAGSPARGAGDDSLRDVGGEAGGESSVQLPGVGQGLARNNHAVELEIFQSDLFSGHNCSALQLSQLSQR